MPNSLLITIFIISILGSAFAFAFLFSKYNENISVIKSLVFGVAGYFFLYIFVSSILFFFDFFSISKAAIICFFAVIGFFVFTTVNIRKLKKIQFCKKELVVFLVVILASVLLSGEKFGFYGMGQDQGVYQTKAIELIYGNNSNVQNFDYALKVLSNPDDYTYFRDKIRELQGYYLVGQTEPFYADETAGGESGLEGIYHGLPTWPAILGLFGRMFGMGNMQQCQTIFLVCYLMMVFYILENFRIKTLYEVVGLSVLGITPLVIWVSKSALTEMLLALIIAVFVYLACHENKDVRLYMWIPVAVFSVYHVSVYTMMPLFVLCSWMLITADKRKRTVFPAIFMLAGYFWGFVFSLKLETTYTSFNYLRPINKLGRIIKGFAIDVNELVFLVGIVVFICIGITILIPLTLKGQIIEKKLNIFKENTGIIIKIIFLLTIALSVFSMAMNNKGLTLNPGLNLIAISYASGIFAVVLIFAGIFFASKFWFKGIHTVFLNLMFIYTVLWASFLRPKIPYYYYNGRYDVPYLMIIIVLIMVLYRDLGKMMWVPIICLSSLVIYLNCDILLVKTPDDTKVEWNVIENELQIDKKQNSAIIIDDRIDTLLEWMLILKASGKDVYPFNGNLDYQTDLLLEYYDNVYYLYENTEEINIRDFSVKEFKPLYQYTFTHSEDLVNEIESWNGYPNRFFTEENHAYMYLYSKNQ